MLKRKRSSGVLLHITSLPAKFGIGDMGPLAFKFADILVNSGQTHWQILPLVPTNLRTGNSPYNSSSSFAGNTLLISPEILENENLLESDFITSLPDLDIYRVDYAAVSSIKEKIVEKAYTSFRKNIAACRPEFEDFCSSNSHWLDDYALYKAIRRESGMPWHLWPASLRDRKDQALREKAQSHAELIGLEKFAQFIFFKQWHSLKTYCKNNGLIIIGDLPFYVNHDSADLWANPEIFRLDPKKKPVFVSGVPPDYFSKTGQLWGNPVYDWARLSATNFEWLLRRTQHCTKLYDIVRLDHFRGFLAYWEVPAEEKTAGNGRWVETPSKEFFDAFLEQFPLLPFTAEDLGVITPDVKEAMDRLGIPGMEVLLFAFGGSSDNPYLPDNHKQNSVVYTGTHDTNTAKGWFLNEATPAERNMFSRYVGRELYEEDVSWELIRLAMQSVADLCIIPLQDVLSLGAEARMNNPSKSTGNWEWRVPIEQFMNDALARLGEMTKTSSRY
ncbi:MAG: 4-alpha-glucanotransferase [Thaumarchaeota archaeon]|nr:4-alpha-glucanotransferase [Nitrososphaerota archaeon]